MFWEETAVLMAVLIMHDLFMFRKPEQTGGLNVFKDNMLGAIKI
jgi:hypothetical protein